MKRGKLQCKDIPDEQIISLWRYLSSLIPSETIPLGHILCYSLPAKLVAAKLDKLESQGLIPERGGFGPLYGLLPRDKNTRFLGHMNLDASRRGREYQYTFNWVKRHYEKTLGA